MIRDTRAGLVSVVTATAGTRRCSGSPLQSLLDLGQGGRLGERGPAQDRQRPRRAGLPGPGEQAASEFGVLVQDADHQLLGDQVGLQLPDPCGGAAAAEAVPCSNVLGPSGLDRPLFRGRATTP